MSAQQLQKWLDYARQEPFGQPWENWLMAIPAHMYASVHTGKNRAPPKFEKFFHVDTESKRQKDTAEFLTWLDSKAE